MKKTAIIAAMILLGAASAGAQSRWGIDTTCLSLWFNEKYFGPGYNGLYNPDSVMLDTCPPPYNPEVWIHRGIHLFVPLWMPWAPPDTILEVPWTDVDTLYIDFHAAFQRI